MGNSKSVIGRDPDILGGVPVFRHSRAPFQALMDYLEGGRTLEEFLSDFPTVTRATAIAALEEAKTLVIAQVTGQMRVLIDECVPRRFKFTLIGGGCECYTVAETG
jgi:uncharacterized protein (DUF433 family)